MKLMLQKNGKLATQLEKANKRIATLKNQENKLTTGPESIETHKDKQSAFRKKLDRTKQEILRLLANEGIQLEDGTNQEQGEAQQGIDKDAAEQSEDQSEYAYLMPTEKVAIDNRRTAKQMLENFRDSSKQKELIDGMGYGDIIQMSKHLGFFQRIELKHMLLNRAEELDITPDTLDDLLTKIPDMEEKMKNYDKMTRKERAEFDEDMRTIKYATLIREAKRGSLRRNLAKIFSRKDDRINTTSNLLRTYSDRKADISDKRFGFLNGLRTTLGKSEISRGSESKDPTRRVVAGNNTRRTDSVGNDAR